MGGQVRVNSNEKRVVLFLFCFEFPGRFLKLYPVDSNANAKAPPIVVGITLTMRKLTKQTNIYDSSP